MQIQPSHIENHTGDSSGVVLIGTELDSRIVGSLLKMKSTGISEVGKTPG
jgi:hypothetical protein